MKPFEERYTAWIDGELEGDDLLRFEEELAQHPDAVEDRNAAHKLGGLLRDFGSAPPLGNEDFFNHQLLSRIQADQAPLRREKEGSGAGWAFGRWGWIGAAACAVGMAYALSQTLIPPKTRPSVFAHNAMSQILDAHAEEPGVSVTPLQSDSDGVTVLWIDGLDYLPASYQLQ
jgi:hypothetical protein